MPVGYGATTATTGPLTNGIPAASGGQGATQRDGQRSGAADLSGGRPLDGPALVQSERGLRATGLDGVTSHEGLQGRVGVEPPLHTSTSHEQSPPLPPAPADHQQPHVLAQRQQAAAQVSTPLAGEDLRDDVSETLQGQAAAAGTRLSAEAQRAMSQLASQRAALVQALQARARGTLGAVETQENANPGGADIEHPERPYDNGEEVVWYSRLQGFLRRRVMEPVREQMETFRRSTPSASPQTTWFGSPLPTSDPLMTPTTRRAMQEWTERQSPLLTGPLLEANTAGLTEEDIQGEVRRQVQSVMTDRDQRMQALQVENAELKNLLTSFLERTNAGGSAQSSGGVQAGDRLHGLGGNESSRPLEVACGFSERGRETSHDPSFGNEQRAQVPGQDPPGLPAQSRADLRPPPGLSVDPRIDLVIQLDYLHNPGRIYGNWLEI